MSGAGHVARTLDGLAETGCAKQVVAEPLLHVLALQGLLEVRGREFEDTVAWPARKQAEEVAQVRVGVIPRFHGDAAGQRVCALLDASLQL